jgi:hypothetical protein
VFEIVGWSLFVYFLLRALNCAFMLSTERNIPHPGEPPAGRLIMRMMVAIIVCCWAWKVLHLG